MTDLLRLRATFDIIGQKYYTTEAIESCELLLKIPRTDDGSCCIFAFKMDGSYKEARYSSME